MTLLRLFLRRQRAAWAGLFRREPADTEPTTLCRCFSLRPSSDYAPHVIHRPDCQWLAAACRLCGGTGHCQRCDGDGADPGGRFDLLEDAAVLRRAARRLDGDEAVALRTLLERLEGAP